MRAGGATILGAVMLLWASAPCAAQRSPADERAASHFRAGTSYLSEGRHEDALREFSEAHRLSGRPQMLYNMGVTLERLERWADAVDVYERFLREAPEDPNRAEAEERLTRARALAAAPVEAGATPGPGVERAPQGDPPGPLPPASGPPGEGPGVLPWVVLGVGAAAGVASLVTGLVAHGIKGDLEERCTAGVCPDHLRDDADRGQALATTSTIFTFVALAGAAVGITLLALGGGGGEDGAPLEAAVLPGPDGVLATARLRF